MGLKENVRNVCVHFIGFKDSWNEFIPEKDWKECFFPIFSRRNVEIKNFFERMQYKKQSRKRQITSHAFNTSTQDFGLIMSNTKMCNSCDTAAREINDRFCYNCGTKLV